MPEYQKKKRTVYLTQAKLEARIANAEIEIGAEYVIVDENYEPDYKFKGVFGVSTTTYVAALLELEAAIPVGQPGWYAHLNPIGLGPRLAIWDANESNPHWTIGAAAIEASSIPVNGGGTNYLTAETKVEGALKELDTQLKSTNDTADLLDARVEDNEEDIVNLKQGVALHEDRIDSIEAIALKQDSDIAGRGDNGLGIVGLGKDVAETTVATKIEGLLLDAPQLLTNSGNPYIDTTGFDVGSVVAGNIQHIVPTNPLIIRYNSSIPVSNGTKWYSIAKMKKLDTTTSTLLTMLQATTSGSTVIFGQIEAEQNKWYFISGIQSSTDHVGNIQIRHVSGGTGEKILQIAYSYLFNISTLIANKQYSPLFGTTFDLLNDVQITMQMDTWVKTGTLPNSIQAVDFNKRVRSVGKNLFDNSRQDWNSFRTTEEIIKLDTGIRVRSTTANDYLQVAYWFEVGKDVQSNTSYVYKTDMIYTSGQAKIIIVADDNKAMFGSDLIDDSSTLTSSQTITRTFTYNGSKRYVGIVFACSYDNSSVGDISYTNLQLELGTVATTYEPYRNTDLYIKGNAKGYSVPNGVKDTIEFRNGKAYRVQRVKKYVLQASDVTLETNTSNVDYIVLSNLTGIITSNYPAIQNHTVPNFIAYSGSSNDFDTTSLIGYSIHSAWWGQDIYLILSKGTYTTLAEAQADLAGTDIYYQLATPIETEIATIGNAVAYPNGTFLIDDMTFDVRQYTTSVTVSNTDYPIKTLDEIYKLNADGSKTKLNVANATIAGNGLSFTHTGLASGNIVSFSYTYRGTNIKGLTTVYYYGDKMIVAGSGTTAGKVYKIVPTVVDENIVWTKVEV